jgi:ParB-like chromosome segregation protein Spo0J
MAAPKITLRKIDELTPDPRNARTHSPEQIDQLAGSIGRFGFTVPGIHDEHDVVRVGNGRLAAVRLIYERGGKVYLAPGQANGGKAIPVGTIPIMDGSGYTEDEWKALALGDNQLALQARWDVEQLTAQLDELAAVNFNIEEIGFDQAALDALASGPDPEAGGGTRNTGGELEDSQFNHADQFAVIVRCADAAEQEARFNRLRDEFGPDNVKVVVV